MNSRLETERLTLRPFTIAGAPALAAQCGLWEVARMTSRIPHPYPDGLAERWIASQDAAREAGTELAFRIALAGDLVGGISLDRQPDGDYEFGYWIAPSHWGRGLASEAARRIVRFAFDELGVDRLSSRYFVDNPASGRVLEKCGFGYTGQETRWSEARGNQVDCRCFRLDRAEAGESTGRP